MRMRTSPLTYTSKNPERGMETTTAPLGEKYSELRNVSVGVGRNDMRQQSKARSKEAKNTYFYNSIYRQMKRYGYLYESIISMDNLRLADMNARKGKSKTYGVRAFDMDREGNLFALHQMLKEKTFKTSKYDIFTIHEPKERVIYRLPYYPDRIVHHAIMNVLEPIWRSVFTSNTYSCIKGRGIHGCAKRVKGIISKYKESEHLYCLKIDIVKFYPNIDHDVMKKIVRKKIKDADTLWLLDEIIDSADGLPIGNYISQYLANLYLAYFMHFVNEDLEVDATEYADDIVFFSDSKERLHGVFDKIRDKLENELKLKVKHNWQLFPIATNRYTHDGRALDYVGYQFFRQQTLIRKSIKKRFCKETRKAIKKGYGEKKMKMQLSSWLGWAEHCNGRHLLRKIDIYDKIKIL